MDIFEKAGRKSSKKNLNRRNGFVSTLVGGDHGCWPVGSHTPTPDNLEEIWKLKGK